MKEEKYQDDVEAGEEISKLQRKLMKVENMLEAAQEDAEAQRKLSAELSWFLLYKINIYIN